MKLRHKMSSVDTAWLRMDRPSNLMMIVGVLMFEGRLDYEWDGDVLVFERSGVNG